MTIRVKFDSSQLTSEEDIMDAFNKAFDFPDYFGRNWDAWIDCMSDELTGDAIEIMVTGTDKLIENHREVLALTLSWWCHAYSLSNTVASFNPDSEKPAPIKPFPCSPIVKAFPMA